MDTKRVVRVDFARTCKSLQVGRRFLRVKGVKGMMVEVSIPFKRESAWKVKSLVATYREDMFRFPSNGKVHGKDGKPVMTSDVFEFQFPSNGKVHGKHQISDLIERVNATVSIPFKRESSWKVGELSPRYRQLPSFQFPSNGKVHGKIYLELTGNAFVYVSIPFKRESSWKVAYARRTAVETVRFQFPSNGKVHGKPGETTSLRFAASAFQFPSNGKVHGKWRTRSQINAPYRRLVSIPFKRESSWKGSNSPTRTESMI